MKEKRNFSILPASWDFVGIFNMQEYKEYKLTEIYMEFFKMLESKHNIILNPGQKKVASHKDGPILAIAVPGSGKTTTMMCRTGFLVESHGVDPRRILSVTFSRASALDMKNRYQYIFGQGRRAPEFSTIHSFANSCINRFDAEKMHSLTIIGSRGVP